MSSWKNEMKGVNCEIGRNYHKYFYDISSKFSTKCEWPLTGHILKDPTRRRRGGIILEKYTFFLNQQFLISYKVSISRNEDSFAGLCRITLISYFLISRDEPHIKSIRPCSSRKKNFLLGDLDHLARLFLSL